MLIYELKKGTPFVTQIIKGFGESDIQTFKTDFRKMHQKHREDVKNLSDGFIFVTGDASVAGNGVKLRSNYLHYLEKAV